MNVLALDIGASSGRGIIGSYTDGILRLQEIYRFSNGYFRMLGGMYWDTAYIHKEILNCLRECKKQNIKLDCIAIDTWSQDYAWINGDGRPIGMPRSYHHPALAKHGGDFEKEMSPLELYKHCGQVRNDFSTLRQLYYDSRFQINSLRDARYMLFIPYLLAYQLCGEMGYDCTLPPIGEVMDIKTGRFSEMLAQKTQAAGKIPPFRECGTILGHTDSSVYEETGYDCVPIACVGAHDTSAAAFAVPENNEYMFVSSGSFAMYGAILEKQIQNDATFSSKLGNSPQCDGKNSLFSGTVGMFVIQQCMKAWKTQGITVSYEELTEYALNHENEACFDFLEIDMSTPDMLTEVSRVLRAVGYHAPETPGDYYVVFANSLSRRIAHDLLSLEKAAERRFERLYMVGGGSQASAVNIRITKLMNRPMMTGLTEASAAGNALMQLVALGELQNCVQAKEVAIRSFPMKVVAI